MMLDLIPLVQFNAIGISRIVNAITILLWNIVNYDLSQCVNRYHFDCEWRPGRWVNIDVLDTEVEIKTV